MPRGSAVQLGEESERGATKEKEAALSLVITVSLEGQRPISGRRPAAEKPASPPVPSLPPLVPASQHELMASPAPSRSHQPPLSCPHHQRADHFVLLSRLSLSLSGSFHSTPSSTQTPASARRSIQLMGTPLVVTSSPPASRDLSLPPPRPSIHPFIFKRRGPICLCSRSTAPPVKSTFTSSSPLTSNPL